MDPFTIAAIVAAGASAYGTYSAKQNAAAARSADRANAYEANAVGTSQMYAQQHFGAEQALQAQQFEAGQAQRQQEVAQFLADRQAGFQQYMSDTAHTREVVDLRRAGLNPILSATGGMGASTPAGGSASPGMARGHPASSGLPSTAKAQSFMAPTFDPAAAVGSAMAAQRTQADIDRINAETREIEARTPRHEADIGKVKAETANVMEDTALKGFLSGKTKEETERIKYELEEVISRIEKWRSETRVREAEIGSTVALEGARKAETAAAYSRSARDIAETRVASAREHQVRAETDRTREMAVTEGVNARALQDLEESKLMTLLKASPLLSPAAGLLKSIILRIR